MIVLPGGGYAEHAPHEAGPIADWLGQIGVPASRGVPHAVHVFAHGPHSLGLARGAGHTELWTMLAETWIHEQV